MADRDILTIRKAQQRRAVEGLLVGGERLVFEVVILYTIREGRSLPVHAAFTGQGDIMCPVGIDQAISEIFEIVDRPARSFQTGIVGQRSAAEQPGVRPHMQGDVVFQGDRPAQVLAWRQVDGTAAHGCASIDRCLDGDGIQGKTIAFRTVVPNRNYINHQAFLLILSSDPGLHGVSKLLAINSHFVPGCLGLGRHRCLQIWQQAFESLLLTQSTAHKIIQDSHHIIVG